MTTMDAPISISESRPKPTSATDRAATAANASTTIPTTFHPSVAYSRANPRRSNVSRKSPARRRSTDDQPGERAEDEPRVVLDGGVADAHLHLVRGAVRHERARVGPFEVDVAGKGEHGANRKDGQQERSGRAGHQPTGDAGDAAGQHQRDERYRDEHHVV